MTDDKVKTCCVCGKPATNRHMSIVGQIPYWVCVEHYASTFPAIGYDENIKMNRMGLLDKDMKWVQLIAK